MLFHSKKACADPYTLKKMSGFELLPNNVRKSDKKTFLINLKSCAGGDNVNKLDSWTESVWVFKTACFR